MNRPPKADTFKRTNIIGKSIELDLNGTLEDYEIVGVVKNGVNLLQSMLGEFVPSFHSFF